MMGGHPTTHHIPYFNEAKGVLWVWSGGSSIITQ